MSDANLRSLLATPALALRLVSGADEAVDRPLRWVHSTDLPDPTPFLADDLALLTTGGQFDGQTSPEEYVDRLAARGVAGLGFGTGVRHPEVPVALVEACASAGIPLFEVPYETPFIAVARAHAEAVAAQAFARRSWALDTQRALAAAALRPHGLVAIIAELGRRLDAWVAMFDAAGALTLEHPPGGISPAARAELDGHVSDVLARGAEAGRSVVLDGHAVQLFTLGRSRGLRGAIAIAAPGLDSEARAVVTSVIAMAGLALEQTEELEDARRRLHSQLLVSLLADDDALARQVLGTLPALPVIVAVAPDAGPGALEEWWERRRAERGSRAFLASSPEGVVVCLPETDAALLDEAAERFGIRIGASEGVDYTAFSHAHGQALSALRRGGSGVTRFAEASASGILAALRTDDAGLVAQSRLAPLRAADPDLEHTLRVWLEHDARLDPAASALGIHRHTLRSRVAQASRLLGLDLSAFPARAELWALLQASPTA
ncbi:PucR family transcriptional regulator ligand-binding domain-containing protein [Microbacterium sp. NPDC077644]|uniref:PucR family transcriptional regulator n=1 Tax=Microbacterium sp. NPDC077644 TaxID=3155055 RepID=UPI00344B2628